MLAFAAGRAGGFITAFAPAPAATGAAGTSGLERSRCCGWEVDIHAVVDRAEAAPEDDELVAEAAEAIPAPLLVFV